MVEPFYRPLRVSMFTSGAKELPDDLVKNMVRDEIYTTLLAMGVPMEKVNDCDHELLSEIPNMRKMPPEQAFKRGVELSKECLRRLGVDQSFIDQLQFE